MGRGPGNRQQQILAAVAEHGALYLTSLAGSPAEYQSLYRAAVKLSDAGRIGILVYQYGCTGMGSDAPKVVIHAPDITQQDIDRQRLNRLHSELRPRGRQAPKKGR